MGLVPYLKPQAVAVDPASPDRFYSAGTSGILLHTPDARLEPRSITPASDGRWLVASGATHVLWDTESWIVNALPPIPPCPPPAGAAAFSPSTPDQPTAFLAVASAGNRIVLIELATRRIAATLEAPEGRVLYQLSFSPDLRWLLAASAQGEIQAWDITHLRSLLH